MDPKWIKTENKEVFRVNFSLFQVVVLRTQP